MIRVPLLALLPVLALLSLVTPAWAAEQVTPLPKAATASTSTSAGPCAHWAFFRNEAGVPLDLKVGADRPRILAAGQTARTCATQDRVPWSVAAHAGWRYGGIADLRDLTRRTVVLDAPGATVEIVNHSGDIQTLTLDDRDVGAMQPRADQPLLLGPIVAGHHRLLARGKHGREWRPVELSLQAGVTRRIAFDPLPTSVEVSNLAKEPVRVRIDGSPWGKLAPGATVQILGLVPGVHQVQLVGEKSGDLRALSVTAGLTEQPPGPSAEIIVHVANATGEILKLPDALRDLGLQMQPGQKADWRLKRGTYGITLRGEASGLEYQLGMHADRDPNELPWTVERPTALLQLRNGAGEPVVVTLAETGTIEMGVGESRDVVVRAGRIDIEADTLDTGRHLHGGLFLKPGAGAIWVAKAALTAVTVHNEDMEPVLVRVDGELRGEIVPAGDMRFTLDPGRHDLALLGRVTGAQAEGALVLRDGDLRKTTFTPPDATVHVDNRRGGNKVTVLVRGVQAAEVGPQVRGAVPVSPGRLVVEVRDSTSGRSTHWQGRVAPMQQAEVSMPPLSTTGLEATLEGDNRGVRVWLDDGEPFQMQNSKLWRLEGLRPGTHVLHIEIDGREMRRRIELDAHKPLNRFLLRPTRR